MLYMLNAEPDSWIHRTTEPESTEQTWFWKERDCRDSVNAQLRLTYGDLKFILEGLGFGDDEYLSIRHHSGEDDPVNADGREVVAYWSEGSNEGWYVVVRWRGARDVDLWRTGLVAKFWDWERAELCTNVASRLIQGLPLPDLRIKLPWRPDYDVFPDEYYEAYKAVKAAVKAGQG